MNGFIKLSTLTRRILIACLLTCTFSITSGAYVNPVTIDGVRYDVMGSIATVIPLEKGNYSGCVTIPPKIVVQQSKYLKEYTVTSISRAFQNCPELTAVSIPNSVKYIDSFAFMRCTSLTSIVIPESVERIADCAFSECTSLKKIDIPESVKSIQQLAFDGCTSLEEVSIPRSIRKWVRNAFRGCSALTNVHLAEGIKVVGGFPDCIALKEITIPCGVTEIGDFSNCSSLTSISIPDGVTKIDSFYGCAALKEITIPNGVTEIPGSAFGYCDSLQSVSLPESVENIREAAFLRCSRLVSVNIPERVKQIEKWTFKSCDSLRRVIIPEGVTSIGDEAFEHCGKLQALNIPDGVTRIGDGAFHLCKELQAVNIPDGVTRIGDRTFSFCLKLQTVDIPDGVREIGIEAFSYCCLKEITIPDSVTVIARQAFLSAGLESVIIGRKVESIGDEAFFCFNLKSVTCRAHTPPTSGENIFSEATYLNGRLYVRAKLVIVYKKASPWLKFHHIIGVAPSPEEPWFLTEAADELLKTVVLYQNPDILYTGRLEIPRTVNSNGSVWTVVALGRRAFADCDSITDVIVPETVKLIGEESFADCRSLEHIVIPESVDSIGRNAFKGCVAIADARLGRLCETSEAKGRKVAAGSGLSIGCGAFRDCASLTSLVLGSNVTCIADSSFAGCRSISGVWCHVAQPVSIHSAAFDEATFASASLYVPVFAIADYMRDPVWGHFHTIRGIASTRIRDTNAGGVSVRRVSGDVMVISGAAPATVLVYDSTGRLVCQGISVVSVMQHGVYVVCAAGQIFKVAM